MYRFIVVSEKVHTHTHTLPFKTIAGNKWSLGEIIVAGRDKTCQFDHLPVTDRPFVYSPSLALFSGAPISGVIVVQVPQVYSFLGAQFSWLSGQKSVYLLSYQGHATQ